MLKMRNFVKNQDGVSVSIFALLFMMLLCMVGVVIDGGMLYVTKTHLQKTANAAVLSGAQELNNNNNEVKSIVNYILTAHNELESLEKLEFPEDKKVTIYLTKEVMTPFYRLFGVEKVPVSVKASAALFGSTKSSIFDYLIFSEDPKKTFYVSGSKNKFNGKVHINGPSEISGSDNQFNDIYEYVGKLKNSGGNNKFPNGKEKSVYMDILDISKDEYKANATTVYNRKKTFSNSNTNVDGIIYVEGDVVFSGGHISGKGTVFATGNIILSGSNLKYKSDDDSVAFYSLKDIEIPGSDGEFHGLFYAPNGNIKLNGSKNTIKGSLIAKEFESISGSDLNLVYDGRYRETLSENLQIKLVK
ncbi:Tad domain-containing protein [Anaeromicrobium sediminis]|uniref:Uncharacterized protein n=1 Tax=Anaeromicrobium sediminis TaxID=1478221 RepID=A0A267MFX1_9FIRM|nr:Tad domain-containing protein [Anaeromicrobium sediminis]PAB58367.1 hypothetical protein CCE28_15630 [Anaeromicrobium sediminis]